MCASYINHSGAFQHSQCHPNPQKYNDNDIIIKQDENRQAIVIMNKMDYVKEAVNNSLTQFSTNFLDLTAIYQIESNERIS